MDKKTKLWLILAASLILMGCILFGGVMTMLKWDFTKLSTIKYETNRYEIPEEYENIQIVTKTADIVFLPSENDHTLVICREEKNVPHTVAVKDNTLVIEAVDERAWYEYIGISFQSPQITVYLPQEQYDTLSVKSNTGNVEIPGNFTFDRINISVSTGSISIENISAEGLDLSVSTGRITVSNVNCVGDVSVRVSTGKASLTDIRCKNFSTRGSTGNISLTNTVAAETLSIKRTTGDVKLDGCDAAEIFIETDTGDVTGTLLSEKVFLVETDTGRIDVPKSVTGGKCEISTDTGDIRIRIQ